MEECYIRPPGNDSVFIPDIEIIRLNNVEITRKEAKDFLKSIDFKAKLHFSKYDEYYEFGWGPIWGLTNWDKKIILYRKSVWILLHELGHLEDDRIKSIEENFAGYTEDEWHDKAFGKRVKNFYDLWCQYEENNEL